MDRQTPEQAISTFDRLWESARKMVFKLAIIQNGGDLQNPRTFAAWRSGEFSTALDSMRDSPTTGTKFHTMTRRKVEEQGVAVIRVQIFDNPALLVHLPNCMDLLVEECRRQNVLYGREDMYLVARWQCEAAGIVLPSSDVGIFDSSDAVFTEYTQSGSIVSRDFYSDRDPRDQAFLTDVTAVRDQILALLPYAHRLQPVGDDDRSIWRETAGAEWTQQMRQGAAAYYTSITPAGSPTHQ